MLLYFDSRCPFLSRLLCLSGGVLLKCGETEMQLGYSENLYFHKAMEDFLQPLDNFLEGDCKTIQKEKKILERKRLDLDACKSRVKKAKSHDSRSEVCTEFDDPFSSALSLFVIIKISFFLFFF